MRSRVAFSFENYYFRDIYIYTHQYRGLINYNINIHTRSREVQRVNPSSGNTGIAYIRRRKLFLETTLIEYYPPPSLFTCIFNYQSYTRNIRLHEVTNF